MSVQGVRKSAQLQYPSSRRTLPLGPEIQEGHHFGLHFGYVKEGRREGGRECVCLSKASEKVHRYSTQAAEELFLSALKFRRGIILDSTLGT